MGLNRIQPNRIQIAGTNDPGFIRHGKVLKGMHCYDKGLLRKILGLILAIFKKSFYFKIEGERTGTYIERMSACRHLVRVRPEKYTSLEARA